MTVQKLKHWGLLLLFAAGITLLYLFLQYRPGKLLFAVGTAGAVLLGSLYLFLEENVFTPVFRKSSLRYVLILRTLASALLIGLGLVFLYLLSGVALLEGAGSTEPADLQYTEWMDGQRLRYIILWSVVSGGVLQLVRLLQEMAGPKTLKHLLSGKYSTPKEEERLLLRIGLKDAKALRSRLGNERYFTLMNDLFHRITPVTQELEAEVASQGDGYIELTLHPRFLAKAADPAIWPKLNGWDSGTGISHDLSYVYLDRVNCTICQIEGPRRQILYLSREREQPVEAKLPSTGSLFCHSGLQADLPPEWQSVNVE